MLFWLTLLGHSAENLPKKIRLFNHNHVALAGIRKSEQHLYIALWEL